MPKVKNYGKWLGWSLLIRSHLLPRTSVGRLLWAACSRAAGIDALAYLPAFHAYLPAMLDFRCRTAAPTTWL